MLLCSGAGGSTSQSTTVSVTAVGGATISGLNFPSNGTTSADVRFRFTGANLLAPYPATYIWRVNPRHQLGYYTTFFWGPDGAFTGNGFYGAHPYPDGGGSSTTTHKWEIAINANDYVNDANGNSTQLGYDVWRTQALVVSKVNAEIETRFYWDLPNTSKVIIHTTQFSNYASTFPAAPYAGYALTFGDAPWSLGNERLSGVLRGIQLYSSTLSVNDILTEANAPLSTSAGSNSIWYLNLNPTPSDISDKSGKGHHPAWVSSGRPSLWTP